MEINGNCLSRNFNFDSIIQMGYSTVVSTLIEDKLSSRYYEGNRDSAALLCKQIKLPMPARVTLLKASTVTGSRLSRMCYTPPVRYSGQRP